MTDKGKCSVCDGIGKNMFNETCTYCNGTGEHNILADQYIKNHICQCITWDRKFCPVCKKICHHDSHCTPKQKIDPGFGGMTSAISIIPSSMVSSDSSVIEIQSTQQEEEFIPA